MKKLVKVVRETEVEVEIKDKLLTEEAIKEFSSCMWKTSVDGLFEYAGVCAVSGFDFIEGLGSAGAVFLVGEGSNDDVKYNVVDDYEEAEVLEELE